MLYLESLEVLARREWVKNVITKVMALHGVTNRNELDSLYNLPIGTTNTLVSNGSFKRVFDLAITASQHFNVSLDYLLLDKEKEIDKRLELKPAIANGVFKAMDAGILSGDYPSIDITAEIILDEIYSSDDAELLHAS